MTADELVERLLEINRPEYDIVVVPSNMVGLDDPDVGEWGWVPSRIVDVRRAMDIGATIEVVVE